MEELNPMKTFLEGKVCVEVGTIKVWMTEEDAKKYKEMSTSKIDLEDIKKYCTGSVKKKRKKKN